MIPPFVEQINNKMIILSLLKFPSLQLYFCFENFWQLKVIYNLRVYMQKRYEVSNNVNKICKEFRKFNFILKLLKENLILAIDTEKWNQFKLNEALFDQVFSTTLPFPKEFDKEKILPALIKNSYNKDKLYNAIIKLIIADREKLVI